MGIIKAAGIHTNQYNDNQQAYHVECGAPSVKIRNPFRRHGADTCMDEHDKSREEEDLVWLWHEIGI